MNWNKIPSLSSLRAFEAAARCQSLSKAAVELNVTHAAVAQHVRSLEAEFSESLLVRQGRGVTPTVAGIQLAEKLSDGFTTIADAVADLKSKTEERPLNLSSTPAFAANWLMPRMGDFWSKHPDIKINITPDIALVDFRRDAIDMAIRYGDGNWSGLEAELLTDGEFWVLASPSIVKDRHVANLQDVSDLPWLMESQMIERRAIVEQGGIDFDDIDLKYLNTNALVVSAAISGLGITVQPKSLVERECEFGTLVKLFELKQADLGYHIVTLPGRNPKGLRLFVNWLRKQAKQGDT